jgi:hypothetical protein
MGERIRLLVADGAAQNVTRRVRESADAAGFELLIPLDNSEAALRAAAPQADALFRPPCLPR